MEKKNLKKGPRGVREIEILMEKNLKKDPRRIAEFEILMEKKIKKGSAGIPAELKFSRKKNLI